MEVESEIKNIIKVWLYAISSLFYCYFISSKIPKGKYRLVSLLPIFYLFTILPYLLSYSFVIAHFTFLLTWLANFKLVLFAFDTGPLSLIDPPKKPLLLFIAIASLPIVIRTTPKRKKVIPLNLPTVFFIGSILLSVLGDHRESSNTIILVSIYCLGVFLVVEVSTGIWVALVRSVSSLDLLPPSDEPYLSTTLQDFWGRRWNLPVTNVLRDTVHNPVRSALGPAFGYEGAKVAAVLATFMVSGLMHELYFYNMTRASSNWELTQFFLLQGVGLVVERWLKKVAGDKWALSGFISTPLAVGFVVVTGYWLFFPQVLRNGVDVRFFKEFRDIMEFTKKNCWSIFNYVQNLRNSSNYATF
ncbi:hypothetical protein LguiA_026593 [Lonicera macranthoides]